MDDIVWNDIVWKPGRGSPRPWPPEQRARLRALVMEGWPRGAIAAELHVTRNAVIGMTWRMGLSAPRPMPDPHRKRIRKPWKPKPKPKPEIIPAMMAPEPPQEPQDASGVVAVDFMHLDHTTCRWPLWDGWARVAFSEQYYCGAPVACHGYPYCGEHSRMAYAHAHGPGIARAMK